MGMLLRRHHKKSRNIPSIEYPVHTGGGWYELSNGEKVQGKQEAEKAEADLR